MYIKQDLPQFQDQRTLIVATGRQEAIFYLTFNGEIEEKERIQVEDPGYTDKEGSYKNSDGSQGIFKAGSIYKEKITYHITREFLNELEEKMKKFQQKNKTAEIYLFCPDYLNKEILKKLPKSLKQKLKVVKFGNYVHSHPFDLLKSIKEDQESNKDKVATPIKEKALKILKKTKKNSDQ